MQVADSFKAYSAGHPHLKVLAVYGGTDAHRSMPCVVAWMLWWEHQAG